MIKTMVGVAIAGILGAKMMSGIAGIVRKKLP